jgi:FlgD Ig-like domain
MTKTKRLLLLSCASIVLGALAIAHAVPPQPMLLRPQISADSLDQYPPFTHWDLREFPGCQVPWAIGSGPVPDLNGDHVVNQADRNVASGIFAQGFAAWQAVSPALIGFVSTPQTAGKTGIALDGYNTVSFGGGALDDQQVVLPDSFVVKGGDIVTPGLNNILETFPEGDDIVSHNKIVDGGNNVAESRANSLPNFPLAGITGIFCNKYTGAIQEADIYLRRQVHWVTDPNPNTCLNDSTYDHVNLRGAVTHEIGHFIGIAHALTVPAKIHTADVTDGKTPTMYAGVAAAFCGNIYNETLEDADKDACNFVYCPDLGDAPDPCFGNYKGFYPSLVHKIAEGRTLNGLVLDGLLPGAEHIFGIKPVQRNRMWTYEWLAFSGGDADAECEANVTDKDPFDDGVTWTPDPPVWGRNLDVTASVAYAKDQFGREHDYDGAPMWVNSFLDLNQDCVWNDTGSEHFMDVPIFSPPPPAGPNDIKYIEVTSSVLLPKNINAELPMYLRTRLDWNENVGQADKVDSTLSFSRYAAQFGEVEDYPFWCREKYEVQWLQNTTGTIMSGAAMVFVGAPGVEQTVSAKVNSSGCPISGGALVSTIYDNGPDESITTFNVPPFIPPFIWWRFGKCKTTPAVPPFDGPLTLARTYWINPSQSFRAGSVVAFDPGARIPSVNLGTCVLSTLGVTNGLQITVGCLDAATGGWIGGYNPITHEWQDTLRVNVSYRVAPAVLTIEQLNPCDPTYLSLPLVPVGSGIVTPNHGYKFTLAVPANIQAGKALIVETTSHWSMNGTVNHQITEFPNPLPTATGVNNSPRPIKLGLENRPNPFNPTTMIRFSLPKATDVTLKVFDVQGRLVRTLIEARSFPFGIHEIEWNGTDNHGVQVSSGVYFYRLTAGQHTLTRKAVLLK